LETKLHERSAIERELEIFIAEPELQQAFDEAYKALRPKLALPGFRPGKAPLGLVKQLHGDSIEGDTLEKLAQDKFREAAEELKIQPLGMPVMTDLHRHAGEGAHFKIMYEIAPEFEVQDFSGMEIEKPIFPITDKDVEERIRKIRYSLAEQEPTDEVADEQTIVTLSMRELEPKEGAEPIASEGVQAYLADPEVMPNIKAGLLGKRVGDKIEVLLPKNPKGQDNTTTEVTEEGPVEITLTEAKKVILPELTEEFIAKISRDKVKTEEELRTDIKQELEAQAITASDEQFEENIVAELLKKHDIPVPKTIVRAILDQMIEEYKERNKQRGYPAEFGLDERAYRERMRPVAEARGKWVLLRDKLITSENLEASDTDLEDLAAKEAEKYGLSKENLLGYYKKNDGIKDRIVSDKLSALLRDRVKMTEKIIASEN
jgi:trigger factor